MEKFMFLFRGSDVYQSERSPEALQSLKEQMVTWLIRLSERGIHLNSEPLETWGKQVSGSAKAVVDSPFGSARDVVGGCTLIQAADIAAAMEIAKSCPILETNATIEVRPVQKLQPVNHN